MQAGLTQGWGLPGLPMPPPRAFSGFENCHLIHDPQVSRETLDSGFPGHAHQWGVGSTKLQAPDGLGFLVQTERAEREMWLMMVGVGSFSGWLSTTGSGRGRGGEVPHYLASLQNRVQEPKRAHAKARWGRGKNTRQSPVRVNSPCHQIFATVTWEVDSTMVMSMNSQVSLSGPNSTLGPFLTYGTCKAGKAVSAPQD